MARSAGLAVAALIAAASLFTATPLAGADAARQVPAATWRLQYYEQSRCFDADNHDSSFGVYIRGHWDHAIDVGARRLPVGGRYTTSYAPIAPGSSEGLYSLAYVNVTLSPSTPLGTYTARMWASDGQATQSVSIELDVQSDCGY